ncbi:ATP-binding cassette domain-containing protein [Spiroplasma endosymbiont of Nebria brevicollis]|uniref:ATP-binding cassette domain-containing protein n=1 Tax=Spiroplasma endosymbiont of Nebria brevicollis TaxID=3066284 RepID=UPI003CC7B05C
MKGNSKTQTKLIVNNILQQYNLSNIAKINPNKLSSGMQKQLMIDAMLIGDPNIIIMDEPTVNLDPNNRFIFFTKINTFKIQNKTVIISSHILDELANVADEFLILDEGKITTKEFINKNDNYCVIKTFTEDDFTKILDALENQIVQIIKTDKTNNEAILQLKLNIKIQDINYLAYKNKITLAKCEKYQDQISDIYHIFNSNEPK